MSEMSEFDTLKYGIAEQPRFSPTDAVEAIKILTPIANAEGYLTTLYGSILVKGRGRDIDIIFIPRKPDAVPSNLWLNIQAQVPKVQIGSNYRSLNGTEARILKFPVLGGYDLIVDANVMDAKRIWTPDEAEGYYVESSTRRQLQNIGLFNLPELNKP